MAEKKIPLRKCTGCNEMKPKKELIRVLKTTEAEIVLDKTGKKNGRGAYLCNSLECFKQARKTKNFARADEIRQELLEKGIVLEDTREGVKWKRA